MVAKKISASAERTPPRRDVLLAIGLGLAVLAFLVWAFLSVGSRTASANRLTEGVITAKHFAPRPQPETELTIGGGELRRREISGDCTFTVRARDSGRDYQVPVDEATFAARQVGDRFVFLRP